MRVPSDLRRSRRALTFAFVGIALAVLVAAALTARFVAQGVERSASETLLATARLQSEFIERDLWERASDARLLARFPTVHSQLEQHASASRDRAADPHFQSILSHTRAAYEYSTVAVFDADARPAAFAGAANLAALTDAVRATIRTRRLTFTHLLVDAQLHTTYGASVPIFAGGDSTKRVVGAVVVLRDANLQLLPLLTMPPGQWRGAQSLLVELVNNTPRVALTTDSANLRTVTRAQAPPMDDRFTAVQLIKGARGAVRGLDYRNVPVLAAAVAVPGAPWMVVTKLPLEELDAARRRPMIGAAFSALALIAIAALALGLLRSATERRANELQRQLAARHLAVTRSSPDGYAVVDAEGRFLEVNDALAEMTGYPKAELLEMQLADVRAELPPEGIPAFLARLIEREHARLEVQWRHKDGRLIDIDVSTTVIRDSGRALLSSYFRDVTGEKQTKSALERMLALYRFLNHAGASLFAARIPQRAFETTCVIAVGEGRFRLAWVGVVDQAAERVRPVAWYGAASEYVQALEISTDALDPKGQGPTALAIREGRTIIANDFANDPRTAPWHQLAAEHRLGASASIPVIVDGKAVAAIMFYAEQPGYFTDELISLLEEVTRLLALVLQSAAAEDRQRAEAEKRHRSEARFRELFDTSPVPLCVCDADTDVVSRVNRTFTEVFGYTLEDVPTGDALAERFYPNPAARAVLRRSFAEDAASARATGVHEHPRELQVRCKDGSERVVNGFVSRVDRDLILGWADITEQRALRATLQQAEEIARLGSFSHDVATGVTRTSPGFLEVLGFDAHLEEPTSEHGVPWLFNLVHPEDRPDLLRRFRDVVDVDTTVRANGPDATPRYLRLRVAVRRDAMGVPLSAVGSVQDVTADVEATNELTRLRDHLQELVDERTAELARANALLHAAKEAADAANRAKSSFLAVMSHEIRTPLNGVIAMAEILARSALEPHDMDAVRTIQHSAGALLAVIDDILDFSKIEAGRMELDVSDVDLAELAEALAESLIPVAQQREVALTLFVAPEVPARARCDATRVRQVIFNLVGNALKFSSGRPGVGRVSLRVEAPATTPPTVQFTVQDNGIGMSPDTLARLFTSFTQGEASTTRRFGGSGLGLAISKRLVDMMGGTIDVTSALDAGTTFVVTLPVQVAARAAPAMRLDGVTCVLDEETMPLCAPDLRRILESAGARVLMERGRGALTVAAGTAPAPCVMILGGDDAERLRASVEATPDARHLALTRARQPLAISDDRRVVTLGCDVLRARRLVRAVAVAAGMASPEVLVEQPAPSPVAAVPLPADEALAQGRLVLVAEDDSTNRKVILRQLSLLGYTAEVATDGEEALRMWREKPYALLLTDLHMPHMDGYALTRAIRATEPMGQRRPILALTANALKEEVARARATGIDDYLTKPVPLETLRTVLAQYLV